MRSPGRTPEVARLDRVGRPPVDQPADSCRRDLKWKHAADRVGAALMLLATAPLLLAVAAGLRVASKRAALVRERRIARDGTSFEMLGFQPVPLLRRWSIDQLPQLVNVLRGEMSFVGPRPERPEFVELFGGNLRHHDGPRRVRPGITGWSQLRLLDGPAPLVERVRWDDWYVENWSLGLDVRIVLRTLLRVLRDDDSAPPTRPV